MQQSRQPGFFSFCLVALVALSLHSTWLFADEPVHLRVVTAEYPPYVIKDSTGYKGFDVDLLNLICEYNNWTYEIREVDFPQVLNYIRNDSADLAIGAIYFTRDRQKEGIAFSQPYYQTGLVMVTRPGFELNTFRDLANHTVVVKSMATGQQFVEAIKRDRGVSMSILSHPSTDTCFQWVASGKADITLNDYQHSLFLISRKYTGQLQVNEGISSSGMILQYSLAFPMGKTFAASHAEKINVAMNQMQESGFLETFRKRWLFPVSEERFNYFWLLILLPVLVISVWLLVQFFRSQLSVRFRKETAKLSAAVDQTSVQVLIITIHGEVEYVNPAYEAFSGDLRQKAESKLCRYLKEPYMTASNSKQILDRLKDGESIHDVITVKSEGSAPAYLDLQFSPIRTLENQVTHAVVFARDITKIRQTESQLRVSEERYKFFLKQSSDGILIIDPESGQIQESNHSAATILGYTETELAMSGLGGFMTAPDLQKIKTHLHGDSFSSSDVQLTHRVGYPVSCDVRINSVSLENSKVWVMTFRDISERKSTEEALRKSEELYRTLFGQTPVGLMTTDAEGMINKVNPKLLEILKLKDPAVLLGQNIFRIGYINHYGLNTLYEKALKELEESSLESVYKLPDTSPLQLKIRVSPLMNPDGSGAGSLTLIEDVTESYRAIAALSQSEERFRTLVESIPAPVMISRMHDGMIIFGNEYTGGRIEAPVSGFVGQPITSFYANPADRELLVKEIQSKGKLSNHEFSAKMPDGKFLDLLLSVSMIRFDDAVCFLSILTDITDRKRAENLLKSSEEKLRLILDNVPAGIILFRSPGIITTANDQFIKMVEGSRDTVIGKRISKIGGLDRLSQPIEQCLSGQSVQFEGAVEIDGRTRFIRANLAPIEAHADGSPAGVGILEDITETFEARQALVASEERYRSMVENMSEGIFQVTESGRFLSANQAMISMLGYTAQEFFQLRLDKDIFVSQLDVGLVFIQAGETTVTRFSDVELKHQNGSSVSVQLKPRVVRDRNGRIQYYEVLVINISDLKASEKEKRKLEEQLIQSQRLESLGTLAGGIAHDFNNVLSMILMASESMKILSGNDDKLNRYADIVASSAERGAAIARQLLLFARDETIDLQPVNLLNTVREVTELLAHSFPKTIRIHTDYQLKHAAILGNAGQIQQVLMNICINARDAMVQKFAETDGIGELLIQVSELQQANLLKMVPEILPGTYVVLKVQDNGSGIEKSVMKRVFEPFFTTKTRGQGTGLGLAIVHGIVRAHHGYIYVDSEVGVGTSFYIIIPNLKTRETIEHPAIADAPSNLKGTILVVDDEELIRETLFEILRTAGFEVLTASNGVEALKVYESHKDTVNLVITDMGMPQMNGLELFKRLRKADPSMKVIIATGYLEHSSKSDLLNRGATDVIFKPFKVQELLGTIASAINSNASIRDEV